jgi:hypothetical protein
LFRASCINFLISKHPKNLDEKIPKANLVTASFEADSAETLTKLCSRWTASVNLLEFEDRIREL